MPSDLAYPLICAQRSLNFKLLIIISRTNKQTKLGHGVQS